jgi:hypothetical protein
MLYPLKGAMPKNLWKFKIASCTNPLNMDNRSYKVVLSFTHMLTDKETEAHRG